MKIKTDESGAVIGFVTIGDMEGAAEYFGDVPDDFAENYKFYSLNDDTLVFDSANKAAAMQAEADLEELNEILAWYGRTDYIPLKVMRGNWETTDQRYLDYLSEYDAKHARAEEIKSQLELY